MPGCCVECNELQVPRDVGNFVTTLGAASYVCACVHKHGGSVLCLRPDAVDMQPICCHVCTYSVCLLVFISEREANIPTCDTTFVHKVFGL